MKPVRAALTAFALVACLSAPATGGTGAHTECDATLDIDHVCIGRDLSLLVFGQPATLDTLGSMLRVAMQDDFDRRILVRAERDASGERINQVFQAIQRAGFRKIALIAEEVPEAPYP